MLPLLVACAGDVDSTKPTTGGGDSGLGIRSCNGHPDLCARPLNEVVFAMTHNGHAYRPAFHDLAANHTGPVAAQLEAGFRGIGFKAYRTDDPDCGADGRYVYHGYPSLGCEPLAAVLAQIDEFLGDNPDEVLVVSVEGSLGVDQLADGFAEADLDRRLHHQDPDAPWPSLGALLDAGTPLFLLASSAEGDPIPGYHHLWTWVQDNDYDAQNPEDLNCEPYRGAPDAPLLLMNHFITRIAPYEPGADEINQPDFIAARAAACAAERRPPSFVFVDFFESGDVVGAVATLNGVD